MATQPASALVPGEIKLMAGDARLAAADADSNDLFVLRHALSNPASQRLTALYNRPREYVYAPEHFSKRVFGAI